MNRNRRWVAGLLGTALLLGSTTLPGALFAQEDDDIDAFMEKVLERRVTNWEDLYRYTVRDREAMDLVGPGGERIESRVGEYTWYVRDGYMVRSPDVVNGVRVSASDREKAEERFLERQREREEERAERAARMRDESEDGDAEGAETPEDGAQREYFLGFPFEPGNYYLVGFEEFEGLEVARIEYYPVQLFEDDDEDADEDSAEWSRRFQKTSRVTLWVLVEEHQIVKVAYDNIGLDFLPYRWLVQVDDVGAELIMHKPFPDEDVWLPREIRVNGELTVATGTYSARYHLEYFDYREAEVAARVRYQLPETEQEEPERERD